MPQRESPGMRRPAGYLLERFPLQGESTLTCFRNLLRASARAAPLGSGWEGAVVAGAIADLRQRAFALTPFARRNQGPPPDCSIRAIPF